MDEYLTRVMLESFLRGDLSPAARRVVVERLLGGYDAWIRHIDPLVEVMRHLERPPPGAESAVEDRYGPAIDRAFAAVRLHGRRASRIKRQKARALDVLKREGIDGLLRLRISHAAISEASLERARELRQTDPEQMVELTKLAAISAHFVAREGYPSDVAADLRARTLAEHANALRIVHRYADAERHLLDAFEHARDGTGDLGLFARLYDLLGSYFGSRYRYDEAVQVFEEVAGMYEDLGDKHLQGRALIQQGLYTGLNGSPEHALRLLEEGARKLDPARDPDLPGIALHNRLLFLAEAGRFREALSLLMEQRDLLESWPAFE